MSNKPLAYRLGIYISVAVTIVYAAFILWAYHYNRKLLNIEAESAAMATMGKINGMVQELVISTEQVTQNIALQSNFYRSNGEIETFLELILKQFEHIKIIQVELQVDSGDTSRYFFSASSKDSLFSFHQGAGGTDCFDLNTQSGLIPDLNRRGWSEPYLCGWHEGVFSAFYLPFRFQDKFEDKRVSGYVICETSLQYFQEEIEKIKIGDRGFTFITSAKGTYMTHPFKEFVMKRSIMNLPHKVFPYDSAFRMRFLRAETGPVIVFPTPFDNEKAWSYPAKIGNGWVMAFTLPSAELNKELRRLLFRMIGVSLVVITLVFFIVFSISGRVMQPLSQISSELQSFSSEHSPPPAGNYNELLALQESLVRLQSMYENFKKREQESNLGRARITAELQAASEIQQSLIPREGTHDFHHFGIAIHSVFEPANIVSGDLYDFYAIDDKRLLFCIGDVSGGGVPAALFMGVAHTFIKSNSSIGSAKDIVYQTNKELCKNNVNQFFLSLFLGIVDTEHNTLNYCNAGHTPTFILSENGTHRVLDNPHGLPLGLFAERPYKDSRIHLSAGDSVIMYTDGISEQIDNNGKYFGTDRIVGLFDVIRGETPEKMAGTIIRNVTDFAGDIPFVDDLTLMILKIEKRNR